MAITIPSLFGSSRETKRAMAPTRLPIAKPNSALGQAHRDLTALYELRASVLPEDGDLFCSSLDAQLLRPLTALHPSPVLNIFQHTYNLQSLRRPKRAPRSKPKHPPGRTKLSVSSRLTRSFSISASPRTRTKRTTPPPTPDPTIVAPQYPLQALTTSAASSTSFQTITANQ